MKLNEIEICKNEHFDKVSEFVRDYCNQYSIKKNISLSIVEKQTKLHLPLLIKGSQSDFTKFPFTRLGDLLDRRFVDFKEYSNLYHEKSGSYLIIDKNTEIVEEQVNCDNKLVCKVTFKEVSPEIGQLIETKLHYLRVEREKPAIRFGMYIDDFEYPICYMSFCNVDRAYQLHSLREVVENNIEFNQVVQLARTYGCGKLPKNSISKLVAHCSKKLAAMNFKYIITAINPLLGFRGSSMVASGFRPFASCPVGYYYDIKDQYCSRRLHVSNYTKSEFLTPPNLLLVRGTNKAANNKLNNINDIKQISLEDFDLELNLISENLLLIRKILEGIWSDLTIYHKTVKAESDPISKGQCGVTTAFLADFFDRLGYHTLFCEGIAVLPNNATIENHCWIKISYHIQDSSNNSDIIIDLTSDQNGFPEAVICNSVSALNQQNIYYNSEKELLVNQIDNENLLVRLSVLEQKLNNIIKIKRSSYDIVQSTMTNE